MNDIGLYIGTLWFDYGERIKVINVDFGGSGGSVRMPYQCQSVYAVNRKRWVETEDFVPVHITEKR